MDEDDRKLVGEYLASRDPARFGDLVDRYQSRVFRLVCSVLGPAQASNGEAEEVTQEVFLRIFRQLPQYRGDAPLGSWIYRIAYRCAVDVRRLARMRYPHESRDAGEAFAASEPRSGSPEMAVVAGEDLRRAVDTLPDLYRTLMHMYYWLDCPVQEIAAALDMPGGTVKSYLARAREMVKSRLQG